MIQVSPNQIPPEQIEQLRQYAAAHPEQFAYPRPAKGTYEIANNQAEKMFWAYKSWIQVVERAEKGSGLEQYFSAQNLEFPLPEGFTPERSVSVSAGGDLMAVDCITDAFTHHLFDDIRDFYMDADLTMSNLESTVYSQAPIGRNSTPNMPAKMNTSEAMLDKFCESGKGINFFSTANNHCWDYGESGLLATLGALNQRGCGYCGTNATPEDREKATIIEKGGIRFGMLSFTCDLNGNSCDKPWRVNEVRVNDLPCNLSLVDRQIAHAQSEKADLIIVHAHWGWEFEMYPHTNIVDAAHRIAEMGADVIVGTHPHVAQPMERYEYQKGGEKKQCLIIYSLGDFVSYHPMTADSRLTYVIRFDAVKGMGPGGERSFITNLRMLPVYILAAKDQDNCFDVRLLRFASVLNDQPDPNGQYRFPLTKEERDDLPRLKTLLSRILLPSDGDALIAD